MQSPSAGPQGVKKRRSHLLNDRHQAPRRGVQSPYFLDRHDVTIRIGSQEKRPWETSSVTRSRATNSVTNSQREPGRLFRQPVSRNTNGTIFITPVGSTLVLTPRQLSRFRIVRTEMGSNYHGLCSQREDRQVIRAKGMRSVVASRVMPTAES
jgi:hypothetical protein